MWTCEAVVTSYPIAKWEVHLKAIDATLPLLVGANSKICYHVDVSQSCYQIAMSDLLGLNDLTGWTATAADCAKVLSGLRAYLESVAARLFGPAITSAARDGVTDFELLAQSWVLRVGHHALVTEHSAFRAVINGIADWKTVHCGSGYLLYDASSLTSDLLGPVECDILDNAYPTGPDCTNASCTIEDAVKCAVIGSSVCVDAFGADITIFCDTAGCSLETECCALNNMLRCCPA